MMMNKDINIKINRATRMVYLSKNIIGNDAENLQANLVFTFEDDFVEGQARLEYRIDGEKRWAIADKQVDKYTVPVKSVMTKEGSIYMQLVVTEGIDENSVPIFKSNVFYMVCGQSINAELEEPEQYPSWIDIANTKLNQVDNLDIDANKVDKVATFEITKKDGSKKIVEIKDGKDGERGEKGEQGIQGETGPQGPKGDTYTLTPQDKTDIANETKEIVMPDLEKEITLVEDKAGNKITLAVDKNYLMTLKMLNSKGKELSTASVDLPLETMVVNARYDSATKELVIVLENGNELKVPIGDLVKGLVSQTTFDSTVKSLQNQITANNDELNQVVGEVSDVKQDVGLIKQEQTLQNKAIQKNVDDIIATNKGVVKNTARIQNIEGTLYDNGVASGEFINIKDSALAEQQSAELGVNKPQETTEGYNLFNVDFPHVALSATVKYILKLKPSTKYTMSSDIAPSATANLYFGGGSSSKNGVNKNNPITIATDEKGEVECQIRIDNQPNPEENFNMYQAVKDGICWIMLNEGIEPKPYEPHTGGIPSPNPNYKQEINKITGSVEYTSCGKNLANGINEGYYLNSMSTVCGKTDKDTGLSIPIKGVDYIVVSSPVIQERYRAACINTLPNQPIGISVYNGINKDGTNTSIVINCKGYKYVIVNATDLSNIQVEYGKVSTPYEPHQAISNTIDLKGNEVLPGDKIRLRFNPMTGKYEKILKKNSGKVILNGSEKWKMLSDTINSNNRFLVDLGNATIISNVHTKSNIYSDKLIAGTLDNSYREVQTISYSNNNNYYQPYGLILYLDVTKKMSLQEFKTWLQANPIEVVYELKDDLKTEINLGEIDIMNMTYYPTTNAFTDKENVLINMKYYRDFTNTIRNLQIDKDTLQAQLQDIESRVKALESRPVALNEPIESEVQNA